MACNPNRVYNIICDVKTISLTVGPLQTAILRIDANTGARVGQLNQSILNQMPTVFRNNLTNFQQWLRDVACSRTEETLENLEQRGISIHFEEPMILNITLNECELEDLFLEWQELPLEPPPKKRKMPPMATPPILRGVLIQGESGIMDFQQLPDDEQALIISLLKLDPQAITNLCLASSAIKNICDQMEFYVDCGLAQKCVLKGLVGVSQLAAVKNITESPNDYLSVASYHNLTKLIESLVQAGANLNPIPSQLQSDLPLVEAIKGGHLDLALYLIAQGANINPSEPGVDINTPLIQAIKSNFTNLALQFIEEGVDLEQRGKFGKTALSVAISTNNNEIIDKLLDIGVDVNTFGFYTTDDTPLTLALKSQQYDLVKKLLEKGAKLREEDYAVIASQDDVQALQIVLDHMPDTELQKALTEAAFFNAQNIVNMLVSKGVDINTADLVGETPLIVAIKYGTENMVDLLLQLGADIELADEEGQTPVMYAVKENRPEILKKLLNKNADVDDYTHNRETALHFAVEHPGTEMVKMLLEKGADPNIEEKTYGHTPLYRALKNCNNQVVSLLLGAGAGLGVAGEPHDTALTFAIKSGCDASMIRMLLTYDLSLFAKPDASGQTPIQLALEKEDFQVVQALQDFYEVGL